MKSFLRALCFAILISVSSVAMAQAPSPTPAPVQVEPNIAPGADPATATRAWLDTIPADKKAKSDAYFEGGYWLILWNFLLGSSIFILLLASGLSARMRNFAERVTRFKAMQVALYGLQFVLVVAVLQFPLLVYEKFFREHAYDLANQTFGAWFGEQLTGLAVELIAFSILVIALNAVFRRAPNTWWIWGTVVVVVLQAIGIMLAPVYIMPLFNKYKPLDNPAISEPILVMARANQIPVTQVFEVDASRQSNRVSANVAGFLGTTRIALNDNLLKQCTLPEIRYVMAHEMGHYVLNHMSKLLLSLAVTGLVAFAIAKWAFDAALRRWGNRWQLRGIADPAALPLLALIFGAISFLGTPVNNTIIRVNEVEADAFGINTSREPDGFAKAAIKLGTYRKMDPSPIEEFIFFDHPSGRARIRMAMDWKSAHLPAGD